MITRDLEMTASERKLYDGLSKEALFALARHWGKAHVKEGREWTRAAEAMLTSLCDAGILPQKYANVLSKRPQRTFAPARKGCAHAR